jgi:protein tyrosine phosphatase (PTP) superfamily phosphohydrolase (DUF442 family)
MIRRLVSLLIPGVIVLGGVPGCRCTDNTRVRYVPPPPGIGTCDRCAANGPLPPRYAPNPVPAPPSSAPAAVPFAPGAAVPPPAQAAVPSSGIQQNNYSVPGAAPAPPPSGGASGVYLEQPEPSASAPGSPMPSDSRSSTPQTPEPPPARDDRDASPAMPVDIPQFAVVKTNVANGQEPFSGGIAWLKSHGYRTVLHIRAPGEDDNAARRNYEQSGLRYLSLEVSPQTLSRAIVDRFNQLVADANNHPLFVYDKDGSLAGGLWYLHFRQADRATEAKAREDAERLGFKQERSDAHLKMWLAVQNLLKDLKS